MLRWSCSLIIVLGLMLDLAPTVWAGPQEPKQPSDFYWEQALAALTGSVVLSTVYLIGFEEGHQALFGDKLERWCEGRARTYGIGSAFIGVGAYGGTHMWSRLVRHIRGDGGLSLALAIGGPWLTAVYLCPVTPRSPWLVLATQVLVASLLAPLGYNADAIIVPEKGHSRTRAPEHRVSVTLWSLRF